MPLDQSNDQAFRPTRTVGEAVLRAFAPRMAKRYVPTGPIRDWLSEAQPARHAAGLDVVERRRDWDRAVGPCVTAGFFKVKKQIPAILHKARLS